MTTINAGSRETQVLAPGYILTATASAAGAGFLRRFVAGTRNAEQNLTIGAGDSASMGPYLVAAEIEVDCTVGTVTWATALPIAQEAAIQSLVSGAGFNQAALAAGRTAAAIQPLIQATAWATSGTFAVGDVRRLSTGQLVVCTTAGAGSVSTEPTFSSTAAMTDNVAVWWALGRQSVTPPVGAPVPVVSEQTTAVGTIYNLVNSPTRFSLPNSATLAGTGSGDTQNSQGWLFTDGSVADNGFGANGRLGWLRTIEFITDSDVVDVGTFSISSAAPLDRLRVWCDDIPVTEAPIVPSGGVTRYQRTSFATTNGRTERVWRVEAPGAMILKGISVTTGSSFRPAPKLGLTALWLSDSFHNTSLPAAVSTVHEYMAIRAMQRAGFRYVLNAGIGGTGYVANNTTKYNVLQVLQNNSFSTYAPNVIVFGHGYNDGDTVSGITTAQAVTNALAAWALARAQYPTAVIHVFGPWSGAKSALASMIAMDTALQAAFIAWADPRSAWESPMTGSTVLRGVLTTGVESWTTGAGYVGATTGTGNSDIYTGSDGAHPSPSGRANVYVPRVVASMRRTMDAYVG